LNVLAAPRAAPPLHDLLGASFVFNAGINAVAWDQDFACFGLANGALAILRARWDGAPQLEHRPGGGIQLAAGTKPPPPPAIFPLHKAAIIALAADPLGGILSGGADGAVLRCMDGEITKLDEKPRRKIHAIAAGRGGRRAFAVGRQAERLGPDGGRITLPAAVTALAYDPSGLHLAIGYDGGVSLEAAGIRRNARLPRPGAHTMLAWHPSGTSLAAASAGGVAVRARTDDDWQSLDGLRGPPTSLAYAADGALVIGGENFVQTWQKGEALRDLALPEAAAPIACHPRLALIACADAQGAIHLSRPRFGDAILLREPGAKITALAFAPDGEALAFAAEDGEAGTIILPDLLFRFGGNR
jgi:hypothetical protein